MHLLLKRMFQTQTETIGKIVYGDNILCYTLEDVKRDEKIPGETRIPKGTYKLVKRTEGGMVEKYRKTYGPNHYMIMLSNVPNYSYVLIHKGNISEESEGCILLGTKYDETNGKYRLLNSAAAYQYLWNTIDSEFRKSNDVYLIILDEED